MFSSTFRARAGGIFSARARHISRRQADGQASQNRHSASAASGTTASSAFSALAALAVAGSCSTAFALAPMDAKSRTSVKEKVREEPPPLGRFAVADAVDTIAP